jgi:hypothetical protein
MIKNFIKLTTGVRVINTHSCWSQLDRFLLTNTVSNLLMVLMTKTLIVLIAGVMVIKLFFVEFDDPDWLLATFL